MLAAPGRLEQMQVPLLLPAETPSAKPKMREFENARESEAFNCRLLPALELEVGPCLPLHAVAVALLSQPLALVGMLDPSWEAFAAAGPSWDACDGKELWCLSAQNGHLSPRGQRIHIRSSSCCITRSGYVIMLRGLRCDGSMDLSQSFCAGRKDVKQSKQAQLCGAKQSVRNETIL